MKMISFTGIPGIWILDILKSILLVPLWPFHSAIYEICFTWLTLVCTPASGSAARWAVGRPSRSLQLHLLLHRMWRFVFKEQWHSAYPSSEVCTQNYNICLLAAQSQVTCFNFGNRPPPVFVFTSRPNIVMPPLIARADLCRAISQEGRYSGIA